VFDIGGTREIPHDIRTSCRQTVFIDARWSFVLEIGTEETTRNIRRTERFAGKLCS